MVLTLGPTYSAAPDFASPSRGVGFEASAFYGLNTTLSVGLAGGLSHHYPYQLNEEERVDGEEIGMVLAGVGANVDILAVVPYVSFMTGVYFHGGALAEEPGAAFGLKGSIGLDYRIVRSWSVGAQVDWHAIAPDLLNYPDFSAFWFRVSYIWDFNAI